MHPVCIYYVYIYINTSQRDNMKLRTALYSLSNFFPAPANVQSVSPAILRFALGRSLGDMHIASDQCQPLVKAAWSPQAGTCPVTHPYTKGGKHPPGRPALQAP